ncbi:hypothetical protein SBRCBS47491_002106 [Sporothrix bragantina]|uniref:Infection structure specific protein n=1 Tax=Sporothrix bragantina TaxID=671064 RepID=A0ABP0B486_9PEZI
MYTKSILLASLAAASAVSAKQLYPGHNQVRRDIVAARQTDTSGGDGSDSTAIPSDVACLTDLASVYDSMPTEPPALVSYIMTVSVTDPCAFTLPASISSVVDSYESELEDWYTSHSADIASALSECPAYSSYASLSDGGDFSGTFSDACTTVTRGGSGGGGGSDTTTTGGAGKTTGTEATTKATGTGTTATTGSSTTIAGATGTSTNAGPKETGMVGVAALAMVGVLGVVAAL